MDPKIIARAGAIILLAGTLLACAVEVARLDHGAAPSLSAMDANIDPLAAELARCKALGAEAANDDAACKRAWARNRERFFAPGAPYQGRPVDPFPVTPDWPQPLPPPKLHLDRAPSAAPPNAGSTPGTGSEGR
jgi:conjugative transfer region protein TrbK